MIDSDTLETRLIEYLATILQVSPPDAIHRGFVPEGADTGIGVTLAGREDADDYDIRQNVRTAIVAGKFQTRREAWKMLDALENAFPAYGVAFEDVHFQSIETDAGGGEPPRQATENGKRRWFASIALHVSAY